MLLGTLTGIYRYSNYSCNIAGSSGGGLFDLQSRLIGITSFLHTGGQNLNFAYPAQYIIPLLKNTPPSPFYQLARNNVSIAYESSVYVSSTEESTIGNPVDT